MWHVDEGSLHAYLDGALDEYPALEARRVREHIETCAECMGQLAAERRVRERAGEVLALATPRVEAPTFEELRAYVRRSQPVTTGISVRLYRIGWAASVVLALGAGWMLRGGRADPMLAPGGGPSLRVPESGRSPAAAVTPGGEAGVAAPEATADAAGREPEPLRLDERVPISAPSGAPEAPLLAQTATPAAARLPATLTDAARGVSEPGSTAAAGRTPTGDDEMTAPRSLDGVGGGAGAVADFVAETPSAPPSPAQGGTNGVPSAVAAGPVRDAEVARRAAPQQRVTSAITAEPTLAGGLSRTVPSDARVGRGTDDEAISLVVPGLEVLAVLPVGEGTTFAGMRALQRLQSGDTLELVHLLQGVDAASLPPLGVGWSELVRQRGEGWLVMRARLPEDALLELLQRLEAPR